MPQWPSGFIRGSEVMHDEGFQHMKEYLMSAPRPAAGGEVVR
jgi:hypothetical protein